MSGEEIRTIRESMGLTQAQLASVLGVHSLTVHKWEKELLTPNPYQMGLLQQFCIAKKHRKDVGEVVATLLISAGAIAALYFLLKLALDDSRSTPAKNK